MRISSAVSRGRKTEDSDVGMGEFSSNLKQVKLPIRPDDSLYTGWPPDLAAIVLFFQTFEVFAKHTAGVKTPEVWSLFLLWPITNWIIRLY